MDFTTKTLRHKHELTLEPGYTLFGTISLVFLWLISPRQRLRHARQRIRERRDQRAVLLQLSRINFVERVRGGVMIIKVSARVLNRRERRHAGFPKWRNIGAGLLDHTGHARALALQNCRQRL